MEEPRSSIDIPVDLCHIISVFNNNFINARISMNIGAEGSGIEHVVCSAQSFSFKHYLRDKFE